MVETQRAKSLRLLSRLPSFRTRIDWGASDYNRAHRMPGSPRKSKFKRKVTAVRRPRNRCVIFDLDDTLYDCFGQRMRVAHRHAAQAMVEAGLNADVEAVYRARIRAFRQNPARKSESAGPGPGTIHRKDLRRRPRQRAHQGSCVS